MRTISALPTCRQSNEAEHDRSHEYKRTDCWEAPTETGARTARPPFYPDPLFLNHFDDIDRRFPHTKCNCAPYTLHLFAVHTPLVPSQ